MVTYRIRVLICYTWALRIWKWKSWRGKMEEQLWLLKKKQQGKVNSQQQWVLLQRKLVQWVFPTFKVLEVPIRGVQESLLVTHRPMFITHIFQEPGIAALCDTLGVVSASCTSCTPGFCEELELLCTSLINAAGEQRQLCIPSCLTEAQWCSAQIKPSTSNEELRTETHGLALQRQECVQRLISMKYEYIHEVVLIYNALTGRVFFLWIRWKRNSEVELKKESVLNCKKEMGFVCF